jgi:hypothetical protein
MRLFIYKVYKIQCLTIQIFVDDERKLLSNTMIITHHTPEQYLFWVLDILNVKFSISKNMSVIHYYSLFRIKQTKNRSTKYFRISRFFFKFISPQKFFSKIDGDDHVNFYVFICIFNLSEEIKEK